MGTKTAAKKLVVGGTVKTAFVAGGLSLVCGAVAYGMTKYVEAGS